MQSGNRRAIVVLTVIALLALPCRYLVQAEDVTLESGLTYFTGTDYDLKLDIARPTDAKTPTPALVFLFGGSWADGSRVQLLPAVLQAAKRGFVAATADYRLTSVRREGRPKYPFPAQVYDAKAAVRWLRANAERYAIDPSRIGVVGWSSGGHLAMMLGFTAETDGLEGESESSPYSSSVQAVVSLAGVSDLVNEYELVVGERVYLEDLLGGTPTQVAENYRRASPISYLRPGLPPVLSIHGDRDEWVPVQQAVNLDARLAALGSPHLLVIKKGGHTDALMSIFLDQVVWDFLAQHLKMESSGPR